MQLSIMERYGSYKDALIQVPPLPTNPHAIETASAFDALDVAGAQTDTALREQRRKVVQSMYRTDIQALVGAAYTDGMASVQSDTMAAVVVNASCHEDQHGPVLVNPTATFCVVDRSHSLEGPLMKESIPAHHRANFNLDVYTPSHTFSVYNSVYDALQGSDVSSVPVDVRIWENGIYQDWMLFVYTRASISKSWDA